MIFFVHIEGFPRKCCVSSLIFLVLLWLFTLSLTKWIVEIGVLFPTFMSFTIEIDWIKTDKHRYCPYLYSPCCHILLFRVCHILVSVSYCISVSNPCPLFIGYCIYQ